MKYFATLIAFLFFNTVFSQNQKITNYSLGRLYERLKSTDYIDYKGNCQGYIDNVMLDYALKFLGDSNMNNNTLIKQIKSENLRDQYKGNIEKIISDYDKNIDYYTSNKEDCPEKRYIFFKNHLTAYELTSKYYLEIYNNEIDRKILLNEYNEKYSLDSIHIVQTKQNENLARINKIKSEYANLETESNIKTIKDEYETNISAIDLTLEAQLEKLENNKILQIKKLTPTNFKANKAKITNDFNNKMNTLIQKKADEKNILKLNYQKSIKDITEKYQPQFDKLNAETNDLNDFNYESVIPNRQDVDDSKFKEKRDLLTSNFKREWTTLFTNMNEIYKPEIFQTNSENK